MTLDEIEDRNEAGGYHDQHEIRALVNEVKRLRAAAQRVVDAADACDREVGRPPSSRSSAPIVRAINAMSALRAALETKS